MDGWMDRTKCRTVAKAGWMTWVDGWTDRLGIATYMQRCGQGERERETDRQTGRQTDRERVSE